MQLVCRKCDSYNTFDRNWIDDTDACATCGATGFWRRPEEPKVPWELEVNDRKFLKSLRIAPE